MDKKSRYKFTKTNVSLGLPNSMQPKINLQSLKGTPDSLELRFKAFGRKPSLGAPVIHWTQKHELI